MLRVYFYTKPLVSIANIKFQPIPPTVKRDIKNKLSICVPVNDIYMEIILIVTQGKI